MNYESTVHQPGIHELKYVVLHKRPRVWSSGIVDETVKKESTG